MGDGNDIEIPTFSIDIEIQKDISIDIEISIYDPFTNYKVESTFFIIMHK